MTLKIDGFPHIVEFVSTNNGVTLYKKADTKVCQGYWLENFISCDNRFYHKVYKFHNRCRIYVNECHGYYVKAQGIRCYINGLMTDAQMEEIGFHKENTIYVD